MEFDRLIAHGVGIDVWQKGNMAVKVFKEDQPKTMVLYEAITQARIEETGLSVPKIIEVSKIDGNWAITMELIEGKMLADLMKENPGKMNEYIEEMVDLQLEIHAKTSPRLIKLKDQLRHDIESLDCIDATRKYELLTRLESMPKHTKLCHGNFSPLNIMKMDGKTYLIDWIAATQGNASADVGVTYLLLTLDYSEEIAERYMDLFCKKSNTEKKYVQAWLPIIAASRLTKGIEKEKDLLMKWIDVVDYE